MVVRVGWCRINARRDQIKEDYFGAVHFERVVRCVIFSYGIKTLEIKSGNRDGSMFKSEFEAMEAMGYLKELNEDTKKKNKSLKTKLKVEEFSGKIKTLRFIIS